MHRHHVEFLRSPYFSTTYIVSCILAHALLYICARITVWLCDSYLPSTILPRVRPAIPSECQTLDIGQPAKENPALPEFNWEHRGGPTFVQAFLLFCCYHFDRKFGQIDDALL